MKIKLAVISDLHCHSKKNNNDVRESYLLTDEELPTLQNPYKSFKELVVRDNIEADVLIMPGDYSNKCCLEGLKMGWGITQDIARLINAKDLISNVGNHDVDSQNLHKKGAFYHIKEIAKTLPTIDNDKNDDFWQNGFVIIEYEDFRILNINSVHSHTNEIDAKHGLFSYDSMSVLEEELKLITDSKFGIAVCHHNIIEHSRQASSSTDYMHHGDELIELLDKYGFELIIHGHKHDPLIRYAPGGGDSSLIFSSGSFSAFKSLLLSGGYNTFHVIDIEIRKNARSVGIIDTWFFVPTKGWKKDVPNPFINSKSGFGIKFDLKEKALQVLNWFKENDYNILNYENDFLPHFNDIKYLIPSDIDKLRGELKKLNILISSGEIDSSTKIEFRSL